MSSHCRFLRPVIVFWLTLLLIINFDDVRAHARSIMYEKLKRPFNNTVSAILVFGDSTVDSGNNNNIHTPTKCNFPPYGRDFVNHIPTGRFSNGRLVTDYIASYVGIKEVVPSYSDQSLSLEELLTGVSFASGGSGFDPLTAQISGVIPVQKQVEHFKEYRRKLEKSIGNEKTDLLIRKAVFIISAGTNDFIVNYFSTPIRRQTYSVSAYQHFLLRNVQNFLQGLMDEGARLIGIVGLPPMGCLPVVITTNSPTLVQPRRCIESENNVGKEYNTLLKNLLKTLQTHDTKLIYADIYEPLSDMVQNPKKYGFNEVSTGCCGSGLFEFAVSCNPKSIVCGDPSQYVFWDAVHPTQAAYYKVFQTLCPVINYALMP